MINKIVTVQNDNSLTIFVQNVKTLVELMRDIHYPHKISTDYLSNFDGVGEEYV